VPSGGGEGMSEPAPTPETDAMFTDNVPEDAQIVAFCARLERERNAARAEREKIREWAGRCQQEMEHQARIAMDFKSERDAARAEQDIAFSLSEHAMFCVHHTDAERVANTIGGNCPICNKAEIRQLRAELADERAKKSDALIAAVNDIERLTSERDALLTELDEAAKGNA